MVRFNVKRMVLAIMAAPILMAGADPAYRAEIEKWRAQRLADLRSPDGWLTLAGLFWLKEGRSTVGTDKVCNIVLPAGSAPSHVGEIQFHDGVITFQALEGAKVTLKGAPVTSVTLKSDEDGSPDILHVNDISMLVIKRGKRIGVRVKDRNSPYLKQFTGISNFPVSERFRLLAKFVPYDPPREIPVPNILGDTEMTPAMGYAEFTLDGQTLRLVAVSEDGFPFFIFRDGTTGHETYPAGRFLYAQPPKNGEVLLDFNKAYNPPCAFTPFATCPLPPKENILHVRIEAGEFRCGH